MSDDELQAAKAAIDAESDLHDWTPAHDAANALYSEVVRLRETLLRVVNSIGDCGSISADEAIAAHGCSEVITYDAYLRTCSIAEQAIPELPARLFIYDTNPAYEMAGHDYTPEQVAMFVAAIPWMRSVLIPKEE